MERSEIAIIIPAYNEALTIQNIIQDVAHPAGCIGPHMPDWRFIAVASYLVVLLVQYSQSAD